MAAGVPPPPINSPSGSYYWLEWYTNLTNFLNGTNIPWVNLNFTGSNLHDILTRLHNTLQSVQGGNAGGDLTGTGNAWHMSGRGSVTAAGVGTGMPSGWSIVHTGTGVYTLTHNLGLLAPNVGALGTSNTTGVLVQWIDVSVLNTIVFHLTNSGGTATDGSFTFVVTS